MSDQTRRARDSIVPGFRFDGKKKLAFFEVTIPLTDGKVRRRTTVEAGTRAEALAKWKLFRDAVLSGTKKREPVTFREYVEAYWKLTSARLAASSVDLESHLLKHHLLPFFGEYELTKINAALVRDFAGIKAKTLSAARVDMTLRLLRKLLRDAVDRETIEVYPVKGRFPSMKAATPKLEFAPEEWQAFLAALDDEAGFRRYVAGRRGEGKVISSPHFGGKPRSFGGGRKPDGEAAGYHFERFRFLRPVFVIALETGLRKSDLLGLRWQAIDFQAGLIRVQMQKTKTEAVIPLTPSCRSALMELRSRTVLGERVFLDETGRPIPEVRLIRAFRIAKEIAGITRRFRFHDLRHSCASRMASAGVSLQVIAKVLGHATITMSQRYARPDENALRAAAEAVSRLPFPGNQSSVLNSGLNSEVFRKAKGVTT